MCSKMYAALGNVYNAEDGEPTAWCVTDKSTQLIEGIAWEDEHGRPVHAFHRNEHGEIVLDYFGGMDLCKHGDICKHCRYRGACLSERHLVQQCDRFFFIPDWMRDKDMPLKRPEIEDGENVLVSYNYISTYLGGEKQDVTPGKALEYALDGYTWEGDVAVSDGILVHGVKKKA